MNCALATRNTSALRAPTRKVVSRKSVAPRALSEVNLVIGGGKKIIEIERKWSLALAPRLYFVSFFVILPPSAALARLLSSLFKAAELLS